MGWQDDADSDRTQGDDGEQRPEWLAPWSYRLRITDTQIIRIADAVRTGGHIKSAVMAEGIYYKRAYEWLTWGANACDRDADPEHDPDAQYMRFFLAVMQAQGIARLRAEQRAYAANPTWWLMRHPEARGDWGSEDERTLFVAAEQTVQEVAAEVEQPALSTDKLRTVVRMLIEAGVAPADTTHEGPQQATG